MRHLPRLVLLLGAVSAATLSSGCTALAVFFASQPAACVSAADCFAGFSCEAGQCVTTADPVGPPLVAPPAVGPQGGSVQGPDGVELVIPAGALASSANIVITRFSGTLVPAGVAPVTPTYQIRPQVTLSTPATLRVPSASCDAACRIFEVAVDPLAEFAVVDGSGLVDGVVTADIRQFGFFVAGHPAQDAGPGPDPDPMDGGGQVDDGGPPDVDGGPTLHRPCGFAPDACVDGERCAADPFSPGSGLCVRPAGALCDAACACCGPLEGDATDGGAPAYCLPEALCGAGPLGAACEATADCDPVTTSACTEVLEARVCTLPCTADTEAEACGSGCCVPSPNDPTEGYCAEEASCSQPVGALCLSDAGCGLATCASVDGIEPARCTEACALGGCGEGLCCFPTDCAGNGQCVPDGVCEDRGLVCTDTCLDDDACPGGHCDRGQCISAAGCECLDHDDCGADEHCLIDASAQAACGVAPGDPCCGVCEPTVAPDCFSDGDCPPVGGEPSLCSDAPDAGPACEDDPFAQCPGTCAAAGDACVLDDDCEGALRCIDHLCL